MDSMERVLAVDDDPVILSLIKTTMKKAEIDVVTFSDGEMALRELQKNQYDLIISDLMMPGMNGDEFFHHAKRLHPQTPVVFLTSSQNIDLAIRVMKMGAHDYLHKPIKGEKLISCINKALLENRRERQIQKTVIEGLIDERDQKSLFSWKSLYKSKEIEQTNRIMSFLSRNIEQGGGFKWLEMLREKVNEQEINLESVTLERTMVDLIMESTEYISRILSDLSFVTSLLESVLPLEDMELHSFIELFKNIYEQEMIPTVAAHKKRISLTIPHIEDDFSLEIHRESLLRVLRELLFNAVKYSTEESKILIQLNIKKHKGADILEISFWNSAKNTGQRDDKNLPVFGIPYEYTESVFELFYTIDQFPVRIPEEEWSQGTGLFIARKMIEKMNGDMDARNIIMNTLQKSSPYVMVTLYLPLSESVGEMESL